MAYQLIRGDATALPLADDSVDLVVTSPPYFALRSYTDGGEHYDGQLGSEATPQAFLDALWAVTAECRRVLKPSGSLWVNLGDSYSGSGGHNNSNIGAPSERGPRSYRRAKWGISEDGRPHQWTRENAAWLAAVVDCDGSIGVHVNKQPEGRSPSFVSWIRVGMMDREVCDRAAEITGLGKVRQDGRGVWTWSVASQQARWVAQRILPWLLIKRRQALAIIELSRHVEQRKARGQWSPLAEEDIAYRRTIKSAVNAWNQREDHDWQPPECEPIPLPYYEWGPPAKSLHGLPWRYAIGCIDQLGLILRAEVIWAKPNGLPESVTDRVRRSHEQWFMFTKEPRYFSAVDEIREPLAYPGPAGERVRNGADQPGANGQRHFGTASLGKLPGSVWEVPTEPLRVPDHLGVDHFAAFASEWPRRIILGWSPSGVCVACGEGRRPVYDRQIVATRGRANRTERDMTADPMVAGTARQHGLGVYGHYELTRTGYACACPDTTAPTTPAVILDPFTGTGTVPAVAHALGRHGIGIDLSADYLRLAEWRCNDPKLRAKVLGTTPAPAPIEGQGSLFGDAA